MTLNPFWFPQKVAYRICNTLLKVLDWLLPVAAPIELIDWTWTDNDRRMVSARLAQVLKDIDHPGHRLNRDIYQAAKRIMVHYERRLWRY